jgi:hypothetical protein
MTTPTFRGFAAALPPEGVHSSFGAARQEE